MMPGIPPLHLILLLWPPNGTEKMVPGITPQLPGGASPAFRSRMMDWSRPERPVPPSPPEHARPPVSVVLPPLSSRFGPRSDPLRGVAAIHKGIDIPGQIGTPVLASGPGTVRFAGRAGTYGLMVEIDHGAGVATRYGHLSRILVGQGLAVAPGQSVALMGSTGRSTGSHLHFEVRLHGMAVDPLPYLRGKMLAAQNGRTYWNTQQQPYLSSFARARAAAADPQETSR